MTRDVITRVVILAGATDSGKTALVSSLYQLFFDGPVADYAFAGSLTLPGFERRCHLTRLESIRSESEGEGPDTQRTPVSDGQRFLHLRLRRPDGPPQDLLLSDFAGEMFYQAIEHREDAARLAVLRRADHLVLLLDGERLATPSTRQEARWEANELLRSLLDADVLHRRTMVHVVTTKWDVIAQPSVEAGAAAFIELTEQQLGQAFASKVGALRFHRVAALPRTPGTTLKFGHALAPLLRLWVEDTLAFPPLPSGVLPMPLERGREFDHFHERHFSGHAPRRGLERHD